MQGLLYYMLYVSCSHGDSQLMNSYSSLLEVTLEIFCRIVIFLLQECLYMYGVFRLNFVNYVNASMLTYVKNDGRQSITVSCVFMPSSD